LAEPECRPGFQIFLSNLLRSSRRHRIRIGAPLRGLQVFQVKQIDGFRPEDAFESSDMIRVRMRVSPSGMATFT
jgi:hypothetical protein